MGAKKELRKTKAELRENNSRYSFFDQINEV
jgi:hypothetical protein